MTKKEQIEQSASELFWKFGFKKVSIEEICRHAKVSRKTFYTYYNNKAALVIYVFGKEIDEAIAYHKEIIAGDQSFSEKMEKMFSYKFEMAKTMSKEFISDFYHPDSTEILDFFNQKVGESMIIVRNFFINGQAKGEMNPELSIDYVMWLMQKAVDMCSREEVISMFPDVESMVRQVSISLVWGIMPVK